jgi:hypothetical protein
MVSADAPGSPSQADSTSRVSARRSSGRRWPLSTTWMPLSDFAVLSCARTFARSSRYSTYARATSCSPERIRASSTWSWISSIWKVPPCGWRRMSAPTAASVSVPTRLRMRAEAAP